MAANPPQSNGTMADFPGPEDSQTMQQSNNEVKDWDVSMFRRSARPMQKEQLLAFRCQRHSLRLPASNIAAMAGLHPYKCLPELLMKLVYQGSLGQELLRNDSRLLGLKLVSDEQVLRDLANKAGAETEKALESALSIKEGRQSVADVELAKQVKKRVVEEAQKTGRLQPIELKALQEGARRAVDTGFGTFHENEALDCYEQLCGWPVTERNAEVRAWPFTDVHVDGVPSVEPLRPAAADAWRRDYAMIDFTRDALGAQVVMPRLDDERPFFSILGSVDGIRDELAPVANAADESDPLSYDDWALRKVVVECKHRMRTIHSTPPLYEQLQAAAYCFMYDADQADIIQVMRPQPKKLKSLPPGMQALDTWIASTPVKSNGLEDEKKEALSAELLGAGSGDNPVSPNAALEAPPGATSTDNVSEQPRILETDDEDGKQSSSSQSSIEASRATTCNSVVVSLAAPGTENKKARVPPVESSTDACDYALPPEPAMTPRASVQSSALKSQDSAAMEPAHSVSLLADTAAGRMAKLPTETSGDSKKPAPIIAVHRVSLDDPIMQHRAQWRAVVLPRLRSFVDAVYRVRADDNLRYRLLISASSASDDEMADAWKLLHDQCPWLLQCNTSFGRRD